MTDTETIRAALVAKAEALAARVQKIEAHLRGVDRDAPDDWSDRAQFLENDEVLEALDNHDREALTQIRDALRRLDAGNYGICTDCDESIPAGRLAALPTTTKCVNCAA